MQYKWCFIRAPRHAAEYYHIGPNGVARNFNWDNLVPLTFPLLSLSSLPFLFLPSLALPSFHLFPNSP